jgi:hypothetical protein
MVSRKFEKANKSANWSLDSAVKPKLAASLATRQPSW